MTETFINFSYNSPHEDIINSSGFNPDGTINTKYTLISMRNLLLENVNILNKLIEAADNIVGIYPVDDNIIEAKINSPAVLEHLIRDKVLVKQVAELDSSSEFNIDELDFPEETNEQRLNMVNSLVNHSDTQSIFGRFSEDNEWESDDDIDDIIDDEKNIKSLVYKYANLMRDADTDSDTTESDDELT